MINHLFKKEKGGKILNGQNRFAYLVKRMVYRYFMEGIPQAAAELSYFLLFSIFPLLIFLNSLLARLNLSIDSLSPMMGILPESLQTLLESYLEYVSELPSISPMIVGIGLTIFFLSRAIRSMMKTVNKTYHIEVNRRMSINVLLSFAFAAGFLVCLVFSFILVVAGKAIFTLFIRYFTIPEAILGITRHASFWILILFIFGFLMLFNKVVPNVYLKFREIWPGALFSLAAWILVSWIFSFYVNNLASYSMLYGSLAAIIILMLWLYMISMILLMGPQLNHILFTMRLYQMDTGK